jgi:predicted phage tail component-like protein
MANIKFHRCGGFAFNNVLVDNTNDIYLLDVVRNATPVKTRYDFIVPKRHGSRTINNRYEDNYIDVIIGFYDVDIEQRRIKQRALLADVININSRLIFLDEPNLFYNAEVVDAIEINETEVFTEATIHFKASFCKYELIGDASDYITSNANFVTDEFNVITNSLAWENINALTLKPITNNGNFEASPLIEIYANTACTSVIVDNGINSFTLSNLTIGETIFVDTEKMIVYKIVDNAKVSVMQRFTGQFITIPIGARTITIKGTSFNINISVNFRNTYIV